MSSDSYKGPGRRSTQRRVDDRSQRFHPAQDPVHELDDRIEREQDVWDGRCICGRMARDSHSCAHELRDQRDRLLDALERIAGEDYRGPRPESARIASEALSTPEGPADGRI